MFLEGEREIQTDEIKAQIQFLIQKYVFEIIFVLPPIKMINYRVNKYKNFINLQLKQRSLKKLMPKVNTQIKQLFTAFLQHFILNLSFTIIFFIFLISSLTMNG